MCKSTSFSSVAMIFITILFNVSCGNRNNSTTDKTTNDTAQTHSVATTSNKQEAASPQVKLEGIMDTLYIEKSTFLGLPEKRLVLKYFIGPAETLTLHGWPTKTDIDNNRFEPVVNLLQLKNGNPTDSPKITFGAGNYLGGIVLKRSEVISIQTAFYLPENKPYNYNYVVFVPANDNAPFTGHFVYKIFLSNYAPDKDSMPFLKMPAKTSAVIAIGKPSPPRNS